MWIAKYKSLKEVGDFLDFLMKEKFIFIETKFDKHSKIWKVKFQDPAHTHEHNENI